MSGPGTRVHASAVCLLAALAAQLALGDGAAAAQSCCGKLDLPLGSAERSANRAGQWVLGAGYALGLLHDGWIEQGYGIERAQLHSLTLDASVGALPWLTPSVALPLHYKHYEARIAGASRTRGVAGAGDVLVLAKLALLGRDSFAPGALRLWVAPGLSLPMGSYRARDDYGRLPPAAQLGTGSFDPVAALFASVGVTGEGSKTLLSLSVVGRVTTENPERFEGGDTLESTLLLSFSQLEDVGLRAGPALRVAGRDTQAGLPLRHSGGTRLHARAGVSLSVAEQTSLSLDLQVPLYARVNGQQLQPLLTAGLGLLWAYP